MKLHRAIALVLMMLLAAALFTWSFYVGLATMSGRSLVSLLIVVGAAAIAGAAFSWRRYFPRRR